MMQTLLHILVARALVSELIRRYWALGYDCTLLEAQKLVYFLSRFIDKRQLDNKLKLDFQAEKFGPYANNLFHLLEKLDGSYLHCEKRIQDATRDEYIWFNQERTDELQTFLNSGEAKNYRDAIDKVFDLIEGFESPLELEALSTIDWLNNQSCLSTDAEQVRHRLNEWPAGQEATNRKQRLFDDELITATSQRVNEFR